MPVYEYRCADCSKKFDVFTPQRMALEGVACRHCHGTNVTKMVSVFASVGAEASDSFAEAPQASSGGGCCGGSCGCGCAN